MKMLKRAFFVALMANISLALPTIKYQDSLEVLEVEIEQNLNNPKIPKLENPESEMRIFDPEIKILGSVVENAEPEQNMANLKEKIAILEQELELLETNIGHQMKNSTLTILQLLEIVNSNLLNFLAVCKANAVSFVVVVVVVVVVVGFFHSVVPQYFVDIYTE